MDKYMRADEATRLKYASRFASVANGWKKWIGEKLGLEKTGAVDKKLALEAEFTKRIGEKQEMQEKYGHLLPEFEKMYAETTPYTKARIYYDETFNRGIQLFRVVNSMERLKSTFENNGEEAYRSLADRYSAYFEDYFEGYEIEIDREVCAALIEHFINSLESEFIPEMLHKQEMFMRNMTPESMTKNLFDPSVATLEGVQEMLAMDGEDFVAAYNELAIAELSGALREKLNSDINPPLNAAADQMADMQRLYMKALMEAFPEKTFWPDANSTLRVTYGYAEGYQPRDAVTYHHVSYLDGVMEKYVPGDYEFDVHPKLIELYENKDYGQYADRETGKVPVCFIGSNHTSGGNSGSPAIDAEGNLIGLNFDRVWEGTMSDINYDRSICRNIMVDIRYVLFVVDKFMGAPHLIEEMELVHPKG